MFRRLVEWYYERYLQDDILQAQIARTKLIASNLEGQKAKYDELYARYTGLLADFEKAGTGQYILIPVRPDKEVLTAMVRCINMAERNKSSIDPAVIYKAIVEAKNGEG